MHLPRGIWGALGALIVACSDSVSEGDPKPALSELSELKVMSFNIWRSGGASIDDTMQAIRMSGADIVGLQECNAETARRIAGELGLNEVHDENGHAILSRFPIVAIGATRDVWG